MKALRLIGRLAVGITLIIAVSGALLLSDWARRSQGQASGPQIGRAHV